MALTKPKTTGILHGLSKLSDIIALLLDFSTGKISGAFTVGNDAAGGPYDFAQLSDAFNHVSYMNAANGMRGQSTYRITVPAGLHRFNALRMRCADFSNVQVCGEGSSKTTIEWIPSNTTDGNCWEMWYSHIGDIVGLKFTMAASVTAPTDKGTVCQAWYGSGQEPWFPAKTANFLDIVSSTIGRISDVVGVGTASGIRLGSFINCQNSTIRNLESSTAQNIRDAYVVYNGSIVGGGYGGVEATQTYNFIVNHESQVTLRNVNASAYSESATQPTPGSVFVDTSRGFTSISAVTQGGSVELFDHCFLLDAGHVVSKIAPGAYTAIGKQVASFGTGSKLVTKLNTLDPVLLLSDNQIIKGNFGETEQNPTSPRMGVVSYAGTGAVFDVQIPAQAVKATIRNKLDNTSILLILNQIATNNTGASILWFNANTTGSNPTLRMYAGSPFNTVGTNYDVVWEK